MAVRTPSSPDWFHMEMTGQAEVEARFEKLAAAIRDKLMRRAMRKTAQPIVDAAKAMVKRRTGALQDSIDYKLTSFGDKGNKLYCIIGPKRNIRVPISLVSSGPHAGKVFVAIPTRYAHLVEFGHRIVDKTGKQVGFVAPVPFMRVAWATYGGEVALATFADDLEQGIAAEPVT